MADIPSDHPAVTIPQQVIGNTALLLAPGSKVKSKVKGGKSKKNKTKQKILGIRINKQSKISPAGWVKILKASKHVNNHYLNPLKAIDDTIITTNKNGKFVYPLKGIIEKEWRQEWIDAFVSNEWELTTGSLNITVNKTNNTTYDIIAENKPDISKSESINSLSRRLALTTRSNDITNFAIEKGNTLPTGATLDSQKKLIVIVSRIILKLGKITLTFTPNHDELTEVWFHEIVCHAGRNSQGNTDTHGDIEVDRFAKDIKQMFPKNTTIPKLSVEIKAYLNAP